MTEDGQESELDTPDVLIDSQQAAPPGMEQGYSMSKMADLRLEYNEEGPLGSIFYLVQILARKVQLEADDVMDRGHTMDGSRPRFTISETFDRTLSTTVSSLQSILDRAASLVGRASAFQIDPLGFLLPTLRGSGSLAELHTAWLAVKSRLEAGHRFWEKYDSEFQTGIHLTSPASTNAEIYTAMQDDSSNSLKLYRLINEVPRHRNIFPEETMKGIGVYQPFELHVDVPPPLVKAFPERPMEEKPVTYYYVKGEKKEKISPPRSSYGAGPGFQIPKDDAYVSKDRPDKGKKKVFIDPPMGHKSASDSSNSAGREELPSRRESNPLYTQGTGSFNSSSYPPQSPFKTSKSFMDGLGTSDRTKERHDRRQSAPLSGIATPFPPTKEYADTAFETPASKIRPSGSFPARDARRESLSPSPPRRHPHRDPDDDGDDDPDDGDLGGHWNPPRRRPPDPPDPPDPGGHRGFGGGGGGGGSGPPDDLGGGIATNPVPKPTSTVGFNLPTIKSEFKREDLPSWDGNHDTAIPYFWKVQRLASMGGTLPRALGFWLPSNLKEGSDVQEWFDMLDPYRQNHMRQHYLNYLRVIRDDYLGRTWLVRMNNEYGLQSFRQVGHELESPQRFIIRRVMHTRMLANGDEGGPLEVYLVMLRAPLSWGSILGIDSIKDTTTLYSRVTENSLTLAYAARESARNVVTADNLVSTLRKLGIQADYRNADSRPRPFTSRRVNLIQRETDEPPAEEDYRFEDLATPALDLNESMDSDSTAEVLRQAFQLLKKRQRPPPEGGYPFQKNDHVTTKLGRLPPSPCKVCGSNNHWDKECPDWDTYISRQPQKRANLTQKTQQGEDLDRAYSSAYISLRSDRIAKAAAEAAQSSQEKLLPQDFESAVPPNLELNQTSSVRGERKSEGSQNRKIRSVTIDEILDEDTVHQANKPKATVHLLESTEEETDTVEEVIQETYQVKIPNDVQDRKSEAYLAHEKKPGIGPEEQKESPLPPPIAENIIFLRRRRVTPPGLSAVGVSVLSAKGHMGHITEPLLDIRFDSGADVSLISESAYRAMKSPPPLQQGLRMNLWQLTDKDTTLAGFIRLPILLRTTDNQVIRSEVEAYVVPNMTVPILLGEDYQVNYEITTSRNVEKGRFIHFTGTPHVVQAQEADPAPDIPKLRHSAHAQAHFVKAKTHSRNKARRQKKKRHEKEVGRTARAAHDYRLRAHECKPIEVMADFGEQRDWLVEKNLLADSNSFFAVPNVLISADKPWIPVSNPSPRPRYIRKGDIIGTLKDPQEFFDTPRDSLHLEDMKKFAALTADIIKTTMTATSQETESQGNHTQSKEEEPQESSFGPKTAEMVDPTIYPSDQLEELIDVGSLPDHLKDRAWAMLRRRINAFGFDGRLGHHPAKVHIRTVDGQVPISVPMYGTSPAKRAVIDSQLDQWFEQGVIEPSISPWSAPVVIAYRNGKPRFCVDYRKLNAVTIPDEFPIPRQSEILSSLSGAQVLSSLDALSGFTQLEMSPEDIEKTAFRTHRGLFQFLRMPFGLRNGPSIFQRVMQSILSPYLWIFCLVYIDDIVIYSKTYEEHIDHLDKVLEAIERAGITLSPSKCHLFYSSILLLGHKVSRLGLSTHLEKVRAILELERPSKLSQLQTFLGMVVYFSAFIPYYADICTPLFALLKKGTPWRWSVDEEFAFRSAKEALRSAPVLGHPVEGLPYRLYTDASDEALGCALQQVQPIAIRDLRNTKVYARLKKLYEDGQPVPKLTTTLSIKINDSPSGGEWGADLESTIVHVERVIAYWSRTFKGAERRYSTTEREALAAKEGLVKFLPFIEGEAIILITDHSALQWARTYENTNRRLATWGTIFAAFPGLEIVHREGRVHSNVDPLSRLPRAPPPHVSPNIEEGPTLTPNNSLVEAQEKAYQSVPARRATYVSWDILDCLENSRSAWVVTRAKSYEEPLPSRDEEGAQTKEHFYPTDRNEYEMTDDESSTADEVVKEAPIRKEYEGATQKPQPPHLNIFVSEELVEKFVQDYQQDSFFFKRWNDPKSDLNSWHPSSRFFKDERGLLFFRDADYQPRLCVPSTQRAFILKEAHEDPFETAHASPEKLWQRLSSRFYWHRMKNDIVRFCRSCDVCQKTKHSNFNRFGFLIPNPIPSRPYESISMDFIVNLPWSNGYNAIYVVVDRLTKHAQFIPTTTGLTSEGFAKLFTKHTASRFGLPESIITDRDPRWTSDFWTAVASFLKTRMALSSAHHPQHDGQTEVVNRLLETMLRAYTSTEKESWEDWLHLLEYAYNSAVHASTGTTPYFLLYGFHPRSPLDFLAPRDEQKLRSFTKGDLASDFLQSLTMHRENARLAIARAQERQARSYNKGRREPPDFKKGDSVLVNPHSLEWVESKGEGAKLVQRWIGPFEVIERINPKVYRLHMSDRYPGLPIFNIEHLKKYIPSPEEFGSRTALPETRISKTDSTYHPIEKIVGHRYAGKGKQIQYLVRWEGYGPQFDEWKSPRDLRNASIYLRRYRQENKL